MRWFIATALIISIAAGTYLLTAHFSGGALPMFGLPLGGQRAVVRAQTLAFWEHVRFKDYGMAAQMLPVTQQTPQAVADFLLKSLKMAPETADILECDVNKVELDSSRKRARVSVTVKYQPLDSQVPGETNLLQIWFHDEVRDVWELDLGKSF